MSKQVARLDIDNVVDRTMYKTKQKGKSSHVLDYHWYEGGKFYSINFPDHFDPTESKFHKHSGVEAAEFYQHHYVVYDVTLGDAVQLAYRQGTVAFINPVLVDRMRVSDIESLTHHWGKWGNCETIHTAVDPLNKDTVYFSAVRDGNSVKILHRTNKSLELEFTNLMPVETFSRVYKLKGLHVPNLNAQQEPDKISLVEGDTADAMLLVELTLLQQSLSGSGYLQMANTVTKARNKIEELLRPQCQGTILNNGDPEDEDS